MTEIRVSATAVEALAATLTELGAAVAELDGVGVDAWAFGGGGAAGMLDQVLGDWAHHRREAARRLTTLGTAARAAGGAYVSVEADTARLLTGGPAE